MIFTDRQLAIEVEETNIICTKTLKQMCEDANVKYETVRQFKWRHPNASNELAVKAVLQPDKLTVKDKCSIEGIPYKMVCRYKEYHKDVTHEQAIKAVKQNLEQKNS